MDVKAVIEYVDEIKGFQDVCMYCTNIKFKVYVQQNQGVCTVLLYEQQFRVYCTSSLYLEKRGRISIR